MFLKILSFELRSYLQKPLFYIYAGALFLLALLIMATVVGVFDNISASVGGITLVNSEYGIYQLLNQMGLFIYFLLPSVVGGMIVKDFADNTHHVLYSYALRKSDYLLAKFSAGIIVACLLVVASALGIIAGSFLPGANPDILAPFSLMNYIKPFLMFILPNILLYGAIVFAVAAFVRNISAGFITVLVLIIIQAVVSSFTQDIENPEWYSLLDPFGAEATDEVTKYWTPYEQNENSIPFSGFILYNRLLWTAVAVLIFLLIYLKFNFSQHAMQFNFRSKNASRVTKRNFGNITSIQLPPVNYNFGFAARWKQFWYLSVQQFLYIIKSWPFIIIAVIGLAFLLLTTEVGNQLFGTKTYPLTWQMLMVSGGIFSLFINLLTFLYSGLLVHRAKTARMYQLEDVTSTPNRVFVVSQLSALVKMQLVLLALIMLSGMLIQIYNGYYRFEIDLYLFQLYGIEFPRYLAWAMLALFIQHLLKNPWAGFFVLLVISIGLGFLDAVGIEQALFKFNQGPTPAYSDMNGFGGRLSGFYFYRFYWIMLGGFFIALSVVLYKRGMPMPFKERLKHFSNNYRGKTQLIASLFLLAFAAMGAKIYYENNIVETYVSAKESEQRIVDYEKTYGKYKNIPQPRIVAVDINLEIYPKSRDFKASGTFVLTNKHPQSINEIHIDYNSYQHEFSFDRSGTFSIRDSIHNYAIYSLDVALQPGDSLNFNFSVKNKPNRLLNNNSPVLHNGTFLNSSILPSFGYDERGELTDDKIRKKNDLPPKERFRTPSDPLALQNNYISLDADWIDFKTTVSTDEGQIAIAPGYLTKQWKENGRNYFSYEMDSKMLNFYSWLSADFEVLKEEYKGIAIEIYYQRGHEFNLERMIEALKDGLDYYQTEFSPYQHRQVRILEFPRTMGTFAQSFANTIPYSEAIGFIAQVEEDNEEALDYVYSVTAHELAHQWWAHQVIGANAQGSTIMSESASEYSALKVLEHKYGKPQMRKFLKEALDRYLLSRSFESKKEKPLMLVENQPYIHYQKGSLILYGLSDLIGEKSMNKALSRYIDSVAFSGPPYTTSLEFVQFLEANTPDSLQYFIDDGFKNISLYSLKVNDAHYTMNNNGNYEVNVELQSMKYYNNDQGKRYFSLPGKDSISFTPKDARKALYSLPLADYVDVGVYTKNSLGKDSLVAVNKVRIDSIRQRFKLQSNVLPTKVAVDPYSILIDDNASDNNFTLKPISVP